MLSPKLGYIGSRTHHRGPPGLLTNLQRLRGHRDQISAIKFLDVSANVPSTSSASGPTFVITTSKDSFLKVWDLSTQHCVQTTIAHRSEVWSLDISPDKSLIFTGSSEGEMKVWRIDSEALSEGLMENESGEVTILFFGCVHYATQFNVCR